MSGFINTVGKVAGTVAAIAAVIPGPHQPVAAAVAVVANFAVQMTPQKPRAVGQVNDRMIGANNPQPYMVGRTYSGGSQLYDDAWGGKVKDVHNPYRFIAATHSCCGPVDALEAVQLDYATVNFSGTAALGYYADYLWRDFQLGERPEADALTPQWGGAPGWGAASKTSSHATLGFSLKWSKDGERFAGGQLPILGAIWRGVKVYDPRLDDTFPGGSGACRLGQEDTYVYSDSPALHSGTYAWGRYVEGKLVFGVDIGDAVDMAKVAAWANVCDVNGWTVNGTIYEPGDKWNNLKRLAEAGGGKPILRGGTLTFDFHAPRPSLHTISKDDLANGQVTARKGKGWKHHHNTLVPRYRQEANQWTYQQAGAVEIAAFLAADGEPKIDERQWDLVTDVDQVTELAIYDLYERRQDGPYSIPCKPHMRDYGPGDCVTIPAELGLHPDREIKALVKRRSIDPKTGLVLLTLEQEDEAKHIAALGAAGVAAVVKALPTGEDLDEAIAQNLLPRTAARRIVAKTVQFPLSSSIGEIDIAAFDATLDDGSIVSLPADTLTGLANDTTFAVLWDIGAADYVAAALPAATELADSDNIFVGWQATPDSGGSYSPPPDAPPGYGGGGDPNYNIP